MLRTEIINRLIQKNNYKSYLEIGIGSGLNFKNIRCSVKRGVDPSVKTNFNMTSDEFFSSNKNKYDIVFIDGLHIFEQVYKDILNALNILNENGTIIVHDCNPNQEWTQLRQSNDVMWHGDVWKAILKLRLSNQYIKLFTIDTDQGCCIITKGEQELLPNKYENYTYNFFEKNKKQILNLITIDDFLKTLE